MNADELRTFALKVHVIDKGIPTTGLLTHLLVSKHGLRQRSYA